MRCPIIFLRGSAEREPVPRKRCMQVVVRSQQIVRARAHLTRADCMHRPRGHGYRRTGLQQPCSPARLPLSRSPHVIECMHSKTYARHANMTKCNSTSGQKFNAAARSLAANARGSGPVLTDPCAAVSFTGAPSAGAPWPSRRPPARETSSAVPMQPHRASHAATATNTTPAAGQTAGAEPTAAAAIATHGHAIIH